MVSSKILLKWYNNNCLNAINFVNGGRFRVQSKRNYNYMQVIYYHMILCNKLSTKLRIIKNLHFSKMNPWLN